MFANELINLGADGSLDVVHDGLLPVLILLSSVLLQAMYFSLSLSLCAACRCTCEYFLVQNNIFIGISSLLYRLKVLHVFRFISLLSPLPTPLDVVHLFLSLLSLVWHVSK